jgi:virulence-associated protein VagC
MNISKIKSKKSGEQSVTIPPELKMADDKVYIKKSGGVLYLIPYHKPWESLIEAAGMFTEDFMDERSQPKPESREKLL